MNESGLAAPSLRWNRIALLAMLAALALFLFVQVGNLVDEVEHLHVAWLMAVRGQRPIDDFFEHHTPLFWHLLGLFYRAGANGPGVFFLGRLLVIALLGLWLVGLARVQASQSGSESFGAGFTFALFGVIATMAQDLVVTRPETLSLGLFGLALWTACSGRRPLLREGLAGGLAMLSAVASPRFLLLAPALLLLAAPGELRWPGWKRLAALTLGAGAALALCIATLLPVRDLLFDLKFSALLQRVGVQQALDLRYLSICIGATVGAAGLALALHQRPRRLELSLWLAHGALLWAACLWSSGLYTYTQAFAPALAWCCLFLAWLESHPVPKSRRPMKEGLTLSALGGVFSTAALLFWSAVGSPYGALAMTQSRMALFAGLPAGVRVLMYPAYHPITVDDASYWGAVLLEDSPGHICLAAEAYRKLHPEETRLPPCSLLAAFRSPSPPAVIARGIYRAALPEEQGSIAEISARDYQESNGLDDLPNRAFGSHVLYRKERIP